MYRVQCAHTSISKCLGVATVSLEKHDELCACDSRLRSRNFIYIALHSLCTPGNVGHNFCVLFVVLLLFAGQMKERERDRENLGIYLFIYLPIALSFLFLCEC